MTTRHNLLFAGLSFTTRYLDLPADNFNIIHVRSLSELWRKAAAELPEVIVLHSRFDTDADPFLKLLAERIPDIKIPFIIVKIQAGARDIIVHDWSEADGEYQQRIVPRKDLHDVILNICGVDTKTSSRKKPQPEATLAKEPDRRAATLQEPSASSKRNSAKERIPTAQQEAPNPQKEDTKKKPAPVVASPAPLPNKTDAITEEVPAAKTVTPVRDKDDEIKEQTPAPEPTAPEAEDTDWGNVGFYDYVDVGGKQYHIQTEVVPREEILITTIVLCGGGVVDSVEYYCSEKDLTTSSPRILAQELHKTTFDKVLRGLIS